MMYQDQKYEIPVIKNERRQHQDQEHGENEWKINQDQGHVKNERKIRQNRGQDDIITKVKEVPVTVERKAPIDLLEPLGNAGM